MFSRSALLQKYSRANLDAMVQWVNDDQVKFDQFFYAMLHDDALRVQQNAAGVVSNSVERFPKLIDAHVGELLYSLDATAVNDAIKRNAMRLFQFITVPPEFEGPLMNLCFRFLEQPGEAVAIKAFALTVLGNLARQYPEIIPELQLIVASQLPHQTPAFRHRAQQVLGSFQKD